MLSEVLGLADRYDMRGMGEAAEAELCAQLSGQNLAAACAAAVRHRRPRLLRSCQVSSPSATVV